MPPSFRVAAIPILVLGLSLAGALAGCGGEEPEATPEGGTVAALPDSTEPPEPAAEAVPPPPQPVMDWLIVPGERVGPLTIASSAADLVAAYGADNVRDAPYPLGEGETEKGTALFPDDPTRRVLILWSDLEKKALPLAARIDGVGSQWKTAEGIAVGTSLKQVESLNGKPFLLYGFDWDYGGQLADSNGGALKDLPHEDPEVGFRGGALLLTFQPGEGATYAAVTGDGTFGSDNPVMQSVDPKVSVIIVSFPEAG